MLTLLYGSLTALLGVYGNVKAQKSLVWTGPFMPSRAGPVGGKKALDVKKNGKMDS